MLDSVVGFVAGVHTEPLELGFDARHDMLCSVGDEKDNGQTKSSIQKSFQSGGAGAYLRQHLLLPTTTEFGGHGAWSLMHA